MTVRVPVTRVPRPPPSPASPSAGAGGLEDAGVLLEDAGVVMERDMRRARRLAWLLDARFSFAGVRFGLDALVGLVPAVGDTATAVVGSYLVYLAWKHGLGKRVIAAMIANLVFDWLIGLVPWLGDAFDVIFKAHLRNLRLLEAAVARRKGHG